MRRFKILVVEDEAADALVRLLKQRIPDCDVDAFSDVASAKAAIAALADQGGAYDVAILDFKLPKEPGEHALNIDDSLCALVSHRMPDTIVVHISAYMKDPLVQEHINKAHPPTRRGFSFDKNEQENSELILQVKQTLYGGVIERELRMLEGRPGWEGLRGRADLAALSTTALMDRLRQDVEKYWKDLHPALQTTLESILGIDRQPDGSVVAHIK